MYLTEKLGWFNAYFTEIPLLNFIQQFIGKMINVENLSIAIKIMVIMIILLVVAIYTMLYNKKKRHFKLLMIRSKLEPLISQFIIEESPATEQQLNELNTFIDNSLARQYLIDELIRSKQNYSGEVADRIVTIYLGLDLKKFSIEKIQPKKKWYTIARGIQELYMMEQSDMYETINAYTNASNEYLRNEAQIGMIHLIGFKGLEFLDTVTYPITDWQQLKLLEQLKRFPQKEDFSAHIPNWINSENSSAAVFALKLCYEYQQIELVSEITKCLEHDSSRVRTEAIITLIKLENAQTPDILLAHFNKASRADKIIILDAMSKIATEENAEAIKAIIENPDNLIKLKASIVLTKCSTSGLQFIKDKSIEKPEPFKRIVNHILAVS